MARARSFNSVWIVWGDDITVAQNDTTERFDFASEAELNAFLEGLSAAGSWDESLQWEQCDTEEEAEAYVSAIRAEEAEQQSLEDE